ncbi:MAG TPA: hypothetical protein VJ772_06445 [Nitrososphaeraceae archaeon]|nr:hypothetical protein [Nitrososphaeraceae archaeon]
MKRPNPYPLNTDLVTEFLDVNNPFLGKPFYCDDTEYDGIRDCCFNHMIGMPKKNDEVHPLYDYELELKDVIESNQHVWVKKARGIGATTFLTRYLGWLAVSSNRLKDKAIFIIAGTREEFAAVIKKKIEKLFDIQYKHLIRDSKYTECYINDVWFKVFPTKNLDDVRGYTDVSYLFIDEGDSFKPLEREQLLFVVKAYQEKSRCQIILVGTAGPSGGLFETIENDPKSVFYKHRMLVDKGRGKIFDDKFLDEQKESDPAFYAREYEGKYGYGLGNVFLYEEIEQCLTDEIAIPNDSCSVSVGIDPGFGSSKFAITVLQLEDNVLKVMYAQQFDKASYEAMITKVTQLRYKYKPQKVYVDKANPEFIKSLKTQFNETQNYEQIIEQATRDKINYEHRMFVVPISFNEKGSELLNRFRHVVSKGWIQINKTEHTALLTDMRQACFKDNSNLDKTRTDSTFDLLDSTRLALSMFPLARRVK